MIYRFYYTAARGSRRASTRTAPLVFDAAHTYNDDAAPLQATRTYEWIHSLSRVVGALLGAGLALDFLHEHPGLPWPPFPMCVRGEDRMWHLPDGLPAFPLSYSLRARKPEVRRRRS